MPLIGSTLVRSLLLAAALLPRVAQATWTVVAVDPDTEEVGAVGATCGPFVWKIAQVTPAHGAVSSLFATNTGARKDIAEALGQGDAPDQALEMVLADDYDDDLDIRQYAIASLAGPGAVYTGDTCDDWNGDYAGDTMAAAGNTLVSEAVLDDAVSVFLDSQGQDLADRLLAALEAGAERGGDSRCDADVAAKSAFITVARPGDDRPYLDLTASSGDGAVWALRDKYDSGKLRTLHCAAAGGAPGPLALLGMLGMLVLVARRRRQA